MIQSLFLIISKHYKFIKTFHIFGIKKPPTGGRFSSTRNIKNWAESSNYEHFNIK